MQNDITNKITKVSINEKTFTPEGGSPVTYKRLVLSFVVNGNNHDMEIALTKDKFTILETIPETSDFIQSTFEPSPNNNG